MIKGCSKRVIVLKDTGSDFFEEAYFILKPQRESGKCRTDGEFLAEAQKIIKKNLCGEKLSEKRYTSLFGAGKRIKYIKFLFFTLLGSFSTFAVLYFSGALNI